MNTFLDGSRVAMYIDGKCSDTQWSYARGGMQNDITFSVELQERGKHLLTVANQSITVKVK